MLVLSRKENETIRVGDNVTITILKSKGNTVRIGIEAPREVRVIRGELNRSESKDSGPAVICTPAVADTKCAALPASKSRCATDTQCEAENPAEQTRCAADYEGDRWNIPSMKRRVAKACAQRRATRA